MSDVFGADCLDSLARVEAMKAAWDGDLTARARARELEGQSFTRRGPEDDDVAEFWGIEARSGAMHFACARHRAAVIRSVDDRDLVVHVASVAGEECELCDRA